LYELCTLRHPFTARNQGALVYKIMTGKYEALSSKKYSSSIVRLVDNLLQRDPKKRPSAREILRMDLFDDDDSSGEEEEEEKEEELSTTTTTTTPRRPPPPRQKNRVRTRERVRGGRVGKAIKMARERKLGDDGRPVVRRRGVLKKIKQTKRKKKKLFVKEPFEQHLKTTVIRDEDEKDATVDCNDDDDDDDEFKDTFDDCFVDTVKIVDDDDDDHRNDDDDRNDEEEEEEEEEDMSFRNVETEWSIRNADSSIEEDDDDEDDDDEEEKTSSEEETENVNNNQNPPPSKLETATTTLDELQNEVLNDRMRRLRGYIDASRRTCIQMIDNDEKTFQRTYHILKKQKKTALGVLEDHLQHETEMPFSFCASRVESVLMMLSYESQLDETEREILNMYHN
jgi:serine/threonine protein kinase